MTDEVVTQSWRTSIVKILRGVLLALLFSFAIGLLIGTVIRYRIDGPSVRYIGAFPAESVGGGMRSAAASGPLHVA